MITNATRWANESESRGPVAPPEVALEILGALQDIRFGSVEVVVHDGKVVQIERKEKFRPADQGGEKRQPRK